MQYKGHPGVKRQVHKAVFEEVIAVNKSDFI